MYFKSSTVWETCPEYVQVWWTTKGCYKVVLRGCCASPLLHLPVPSTGVWNIKCLKARLFHWESHSLRKNFTMLAKRLICAFLSITTQLFYCDKIDISLDNFCNQYLCNFCISIPSAPRLSSILHSGPLNPQRRSRPFHIVSPSHYLRREEKYFNAKQ